jgi:Galactose oxidase, central domain
VAASPPARPVSARWQLTSSLATGHSNTRLTQLPDGRVLAISGATASGALTPAAESYDPGTGRWTQAGALNDARVAFGQPSVLPDGDVLVAGGTNVNVVDYATAELYNPATNQWTLTGSLSTSRRYDVQVELANGRYWSPPGHTARRPAPGT